MHYNLTIDVKPLRSSLPKHDEKIAMIKLKHGDYLFLNNQWFDKMDNDKLLSNYTNCK
jgi:hypothetical protein